MWNQFQNVNASLVDGEWMRFLNPQSPSGTTRTSALEREFIACHFSARSDLLPVNRTSGKLEEVRLDGEVTGVRRRGAGKAPVIEALHIVLSRRTPWAAMYCWNPTLHAIEGHRGRPSGAIGIRGAEEHDATQSSP